MHVEKLKILPVNLMEYNTKHSVVSIHKCKYYCSSIVGWVFIT